MTRRKRRNFPSTTTENGNVSHGRDADDPQDLRLCVDRAHWIFCHEEGMQIRETEKIKIIVDKTGIM